MKLKYILASCVGLATCFSAVADQAFRNHRYDALKATPTVAGQTVFVGNSITNMHSWFEAFGSHQEVIGRGNSGGLTTEVLDNLESYIDSKPAKLFLMIGTNDISTGVSAADNARRVETIVKRVRLESPETEVYVQSILPRGTNVKPDYEQCNTLVSAWVEALNDPKVQFINLSTVCDPIKNNLTWTHDYLHPRPIGYAAWTHYIEQQVGYSSVYPETITTQESCGLSGSDAARAEQFPYYPVSEGDVLFFGDEQVHGAEWHELLRSNKIKDRGIKWGWGGINLTQAKNVVAKALEGQAVKPAKIFLFYGIGGTDETNYRALVDEAKTQAPEAGIYLVSLSPSTDANTDAARVNFNTVLQTVAQEKGATYVDVYTPLNADVAQNIMHTNYISGRGYIVMANELAKYLAEEGVNPVSLEEYQTVYTNRNNRRLIGNALTNALMLEYGVNPGEIKESHRAEIDVKIAEAVELINSADLNVDDANAMVTALNTTINTARADVNMPVASTDEETHWYLLTSNSGSKTLSINVSDFSSLIGVAGASTTVSTGQNLWKFVAREDGTYNIVNYLGYYVDPTAGYNTAMSVTTTEPAKGFSLGASNLASYYVIYNTTCQLNQTDKTGLPVYNWGISSSHPNLTDTGCAYAISEFNGSIFDIENTLTISGWYEIQRVSDSKYVTNLDECANQDNVNYYAMQYQADKQPEATKAKNWIHVEINGNVCQFSTLNGMGVTEYVYITRDTPYNYSLPLQTTGAYNVPYWTHFNLDNKNDVIGRSSSAVTPHYFHHINAETLENYDLWTVNIVGNNSATHAFNDTKVTLKESSKVTNYGIATVYNHGTFVLAKGTELTADDFTVTPATNAADNHENAYVEIRPETKEIFVSLFGEPLTSGWYEIQRVSDSKYVTNLDECAKQINTNYYAMQYQADKQPDATTAKNWIYVDVNGSNHQMHTLNGLGVNENVCITRDTPYNYPLTLLPADDAFNVPYWTHFNLDNKNDVIGRSSSAVTPHYFHHINAETLENYDLWTVNIVADNSATHAVSDTKVTFSSSNVANYGIATVYNHGTFVLAKGTELAAGDFTVTPAENADENNEEAYVEIRPETKEIFVSLHGQPITSGWNTIRVLSSTANAKLTSTLVNDGKHNLICLPDELVQNNFPNNYYTVALHTVSEDTPAEAFFRVTKNDASLNIQTPNGHHISDAGTIARTQAAISSTAHSKKLNIATIGNILPWNGTGTNGINGINTDHQGFIGKFSNQSAYYEFAPADLSNYDVYTVNVVNDSQATHATNDVRITYTGEGNKGLNSVYNGGSFFIAKGTPVSEENFSAPENKNNPSPLKTLENNVLTVDYDTNTGIVEIAGEVNGVDVIYDLQGRRLSAPVKGINIINGKKVLVK